MDIQSIIYFLFAGLLLLSAIAVVTAPNPVHSALYLMLSFFAAGVWMMLYAEFLGILLILVYVGAVMVLFLFVVMMLNLNTDTPRAAFRKVLPLAVVVGVIVVVQLGAVVFGYMNRPANPNVVDLLTMGGSNTRKIGYVLFTQYMLAFEMAALILLVALIAAVIITLRGRKESKVQHMGRQAQVRAADRLRMVQVAADVDAHQTVRATDTGGN